MEKKEETKCPKCGNTENFHCNYDYSQKHIPIQDITCNECGHTFKDEINIDKQPYTTGNDE